MMVPIGDPQGHGGMLRLQRMTGAARTQLRVSKHTHEQFCSFCLDSHTNQFTVDSSHQRDAMNSWIPAPKGDDLVADLQSVYGEATSNNIDPMEVYFECITTCSLDDGDCITSCTEVFRQNH